MISEFLVSIIMPAFNSSNTISESIQSVINQSYNNWELIVINDKSTDDTEDIILNHMKNDGRITYIKNGINIGPGRSRNKGLSAAKGRFIAFLDSDDYWKGEKLNKQINFMLNNNYGFTYTLYRRFNDSRSTLSNIIQLPNSLSYSSLLKNTSIAGCLTVILDKDIIGDFLFPNVKSEDLALWLSILKRNHTAFCLEEDLGWYRIAGGPSVSSNKFQTIKSVWFIYRNLEDISLLLSIYYLISYLTNALYRNYIRS